MPSGLLSDQNTQSQIKIGFIGFKYDWKQGWQTFSGSITKHQQNKTKHL